ncbi:MAG: amidohydrolase family protein [Steroidobacteraceae bacterium]
MHTRVADRDRSTSPAGERREVIDCWVNVPLGEPDATASYLFPGLVERWREAASPAGLIAQMEAAGIARAVLVSGWGQVDSVAWIRDAVQRYPGRFAASHIVDPRLGLKTLKLIEHLVRDEGYRLIRMLAFDTQIPYGHPICYPVYAKCAELGVPISLNVGFPGPRVPSACQDPFPLDEICYRFPELTVVMAHGGEPWEDLCVKMMLKWPNLYYMTSAFSPKYYPEAIVHYLNTRGRDKVMWASDHPILPFDRCMSELTHVEFRDQLTRSRFLGENARRLFFVDAGAAPPE